MSEITFKKEMGKWMVIGPAALITEKTFIEVSKADGSTTRVWIRAVFTLGQPEGMVLAAFTDAKAHEEALAFEAQVATQRANDSLAHNLKVQAMQAEIDSRI